MKPPNCMEKENAKLRLGPDGNLTKHKRDLSDWLRKPERIATKTEARLECLQCLKLEALAVHD